MSRFASIIALRSPAARERFDALLAEQAARRDLAVIAIEWRETYASVDLALFHSQVRADQRLAHCDAHGGWMEWLATSGE
jgi:hypothetical protein